MNSQEDEKGFERLTPLPQKGPRRSNRRKTLKKRLSFNYSKSTSNLVTRSETVNSAAASFDNATLSSVSDTETEDNVYESLYGLEEMTQDQVLVDLSMYVVDSIDSIKSIFNDIEEEDLEIITDRGIDLILKSVLASLSVARSLLDAHLPEHIDSNISEEDSSSESDDDSSIFTPSQISNWISTDFLTFKTTKKSKDFRRNTTQVPESPKNAAFIERSSSHLNSISEEQVNTRIKKMTRSFSATNIDTFRTSIGILVFLMSLTNVEFESPMSMRHLICLHKWDFDVFQYAETCNEQPLYLMTKYIFKHQRYNSKFKISNHVLNTFLRRLEESYLDVPYHNSIHAADVVQSMFFYYGCHQFSTLFSPLQLMGGIIASAIHDVGHPGNNNHFEVLSSSDLAVQYNDQSVLENYHLATAFRIIKDPDSNILAHLSREQYREIREFIVTLVLNTDMQVHLRLLNKLKYLIDHKKNMGIFFNSYDSIEDLTTIMGVALHTADISSAAKVQYVSSEWALRIHEEFWSQGDLERNLNLPVTVVMDRNQPNVAKSQTGFITVIVDPMFQVLKEVIPDIQICIDQQNLNLKYWKSRLETLKKICNIRPLTERPSVRSTHTQYYEQPDG